jgi:UDP-N-acetyl-D-mannosaminuronate dehydrogenase
LGYIGLPTALMMASHGVEVIVTDYNKKFVATLKSFALFFISKEIVKKQIHETNLEFLGEELASKYLDSIGLTNVKANK